MLTLAGLIALMLLLVIANASVKVRRQYERAVIPDEYPLKRLP
jgi:regulator of protease activity HflC (stomatin/prohibitin superfamily)